MKVDGRIPLVDKQSGLNQVEYMVSSTSTPTVSTFSRTLKHQVSLGPLSPMVILAVAVQGMLRPTQAQAKDLPGYAKRGLDPPRRQLAIAGLLFCSGLGSGGSAKHPENCISSVSWLRGRFPIYPRQEPWDQIPISPIQSATKGYLKLGGDKGLRKNNSNKT